MALSRRATNLALLATVVVATATGGVAFAVGAEWAAVATGAHGVAGLGVLAFVRPKSRISRRSLARRGRAASASLGLLLVVAAVVAVVSGVAHAAGATSLGVVTTMQVHVGSGLVTCTVLAGHVVVRPERVHRTDFGRRRLLQLAPRALVAVGGWWAVEGAVAVTGASGAARRGTGSHRLAAPTPTVWLDDDVPQVDESTWLVTVADAGGARLIDLDALRAMPAAKVTATLDCTGGWYADAEWRGVRLADLVRPDADDRSVVVTSLTGYRRTFPVRDLDHLLLAVAQDGRPLSPAHGFPARIVAPGRRGFWWVKWVASIETSRRPWWAQLPFPAT